MHFVERQAQGYVIVFDLTRKETFDNVPKWINTLMMHALMENPHILILGNKKDLDEQSQITSQDIEDLHDLYPQALY